VPVNEEQLLDRLYRTAVEPRLWPQVLEQLADAVGGNGIWLSELNAETAEAAAGGAIARLDPAMLQAYIDYYYRVNITAKVDDPSTFLRTWKPHVLTVEDWIEREVLERSEYYNDFMLAQDIHTAMYIRLAMVGGQIATVSIGRPKRTGLFGAEQLATAARLQPHLIRAYNLGREARALRNERDDLADALDRCEAGVFLVNANADIVFANRAAEQLLQAGDGLTAAGRQLSAARSETTRNLHALIKTASDPGKASGGSLAIQRPDAPLPLQVTVTPARSHRSRDLAPAATAFVWVVDLARREPADTRLLRDLFSFSPAEARVAVALLGGASADRAAEDLGLSVFTVRAHIRRLLEKTGVNRQAELMTLLARARPVEPV